VSTNHKTFQGVKFVPRLPELRALEGWYESSEVRFKLSCQFKDLLRSSETKHFKSCFRKGSWHSLQPMLRCKNPKFGVIYVPDRSGDFKARAFVHLELEGVYGHPSEELNFFGLYKERKWLERALVVDKVYGNGLSFEIIRKTLSKTIDCLFSGADSYLE
jgi:hypothetical protein